MFKIKIFRMKYNISRLRQSDLRILGIYAIITFASVLLFLPLIKIYSLHTTYFDLGIFENNSYRISIMGEWQAAFSAHAQWLLLLYGWIYGFMPFASGPYFLVGAQALLLLSPSFLLYRRFGFFISFVYVIYYPLWANVFFDFHFDHLAVPLLMGFYLTFIDRKVGWAVSFATLLIFIKEPFALQTAGCGLLMFWASLRGRSIWGRPLDKNSRYFYVLGSIWLITVGLGYFYFTMSYLLPYFAPVSWEGPLSGEAFGWLGQGLGSILHTIFNQPVMILSDIINTPRKIVYLIVVFGMLAFIPFLHPVYLIPAMPLLAIAMLSRLPNYYDYNTHYTVGLIVPVIFSFAYGMQRMERIWFVFLDSSFKFFQKLNLYFGIDGVKIKDSKQEGIIPALNSMPRVSIANFKQFRFIFYFLILSWILVGHIILSPSPISRLFWLDKVWTYNWHAYIPTERDLMIKSAIEKFISADPEVLVSTQNTLNYSSLAHRRTYTSFPLGINEPIKVINYTNRTLEGFGIYIKTGYKSLPITNDIYAEYVVLDLTRPWFLVDKGCDWIYGNCRNISMSEDFLSWVEYTRSHYDSVFENDGFMIFRRRSL